MSFDAILPYGGKEVEGLAARATLKVHLDQTESPQQKTGVTGWIEGHVEPGKEVDGMAVTDFIAAAGAFLEQTGVKSVYDVWFDRDVVYRISPQLEGEDNHSEALSKAADLARATKGHSKEVGVWSHGMSGDFYLEFRLRFKRVHDAGAAPLILEVAGNPKELTDPTGDNQFELDDRLRRLENSKADVEKENAQVGRRFEAKLQETQAVLKQAFKVKSIEQTSRVDVGSIW